MPETNDAQIILGRPILATASFYIDVRKAQITFEVDGHNLGLCDTKEDVVSPSSYLLDALPFSSEIDMENVLNCDDPPNFDWISYKDPDQRYVKVEFTTLMPPNMTEVEVLVPNESSMNDYCRFNESSMSDYCRFMHIVHSMSPMEGFDADFELGVEQVNSDSRDRA